MSMATMQNIHYFMSYLEENNYDKLIRKTKNQLVASLYILAKYTKTVTELYVGWPFYERSRLQQ